MTDDARRRAEELYEAWREPPLLHWNEIVNPTNVSPLGEINETQIFVRRWNRVVKKVNDVVAQAITERDETIANLQANYDRCFDTLRLVSKQRDEQAEEIVRLQSGRAHAQVSEVRWVKRLRAGSDGKLYQVTESSPPMTQDQLAQAVRAEREQIADEYHEGLRAGLDPGAAFSAALRRGGPSVTQETAP